MKKGFNDEWFIQNCIFAGVNGLINCFYMESYLAR